MTPQSHEHGLWACMHQIAIMITSNDHAAKKIVRSCLTSSMCSMIYIAACSTLNSCTTAQIVSATWKSTHQATTVALCTPHRALLTAQGC